MKIILQLTVKHEGTDVYLLNTEKVRGMNSKGEFNEVKLADELDSMEDGEEVEYYMDDQFVQDLRKLVKHERVFFTLPARVDKMVHISHD